ncbi:hypothetical protein CHU98_g8234 [Xylaria longipes]|nr:hypothetical protein CHU98_g8234 [Xylaria longipes]
MPHIGIVMERSLQDSSWEDAFVNLLSRSAVAALGKRQSVDSISGDIKDAATAFSSWDNCFKSTICKYVQFLSESNYQLIPTDGLSSHYSLLRASLLYLSSGASSDAAAAACRAAANAAIV